MITLICGVGRAGKTTYSQRYENVVHLDSLGHIPYRYMNANKIVANMRDIVIEGIYSKRERRIELLNAYTGENKKCIWLDTPAETVKERLAKTHIPLSDRHFDFEPPSLDEGWDEITIIRGENDAECYRRQK